METPTSTIPPHVSEESSGRSTNKRWKQNGKEVHANTLDADLKEHRRKIIKVSKLLEDKNNIEN